MKERERWAYKRMIQAELPRATGEVQCRCCHGPKDPGNLCCAFCQQHRAVNDHLSWWSGCPQRIANAAKPADTKGA